MAASDLYLTESKKHYLQKYVNSVCGFNLPLDEFDNDTQERMFNFITRKEEIEIKHRDQWGNWEGSFSDAFLDNKLSTPWIDYLIFEKRDDYKNRKPLVNEIPKYPDGKSFALCLTHDIDSLNCISNLTPLINSYKRYFQCSPKNLESIKQLLKSAYELMQNKKKSSALSDIYKFIDAENEKGFKSTFFCFSDTLLKPHYYDSAYQYNDKVLYNGRNKRFVEALKEIIASGWDIGLHGSINSAFDTQILSYERKRLSLAINKDIDSIRQHWLSFDIRKTPYVQKESGFKADSTMGFNRFTGFRAGVSHPYLIWDYQNDREFDLLEVPMVIMDSALFNKNSLELNVELAIKHCLRTMERVNKVGGVLTINWHTDHLHKENWFQVYKIVLDEAMKRNAWGCSVNQLYSHWQQYLSNLKKVGN